MADNPNLGGWGRAAWNSGAWNTPGTVEVTGVSAAEIGTAVATGEANFSATGLVAATAVGSVQVDITVPVTGVQASTAVGRVLIWEKIDPGQIARWDPITYTQAPNWTKIAA